MYQKLSFFVLALLLPFSAYSNTAEIISEKRAEVAMRMIGHEVLLCLGDAESRVMPIEKTDHSYRIPFEFEFGFNPDDIISIVERVMIKTDIATNYLVEVEHCKTKDIVHSFEVGNAAYSDLIACGGRTLPEDCYSLLISILDDADPVENLPAATPDNTSNKPGLPMEEKASDDSASTTLNIEKANPFHLAYLTIPLIILIGFIGYSKKKKSPEEIDPNLIMIGASRFDKRNMVLSFEDKTVKLSNKEVELLALLHSSANAPVEREVLLRNIWGDDGDYIGRTLDVFISKLRKKLEGDTSVKIINIRGIGYKLVMNMP